MIQMTRLDGSTLTLNADLIETIEERPNTIVTLTSEKRFVVRESAQEIVDRVVAYRQMCARPRLLLMSDEERANSGGEHPIEFRPSGRTPDSEEGL